MGKARITWDEVQEHWADVVPTDSKYKTPPEKWQWYYKLEGYIISWEANARLGKSPRTRVKNYITQTCTAAYLVGKIGGGEVFSHTIVWFFNDPRGRYLTMGVVPDHVFEAFVRDQEAIAARMGGRYRERPPHIGV